MKLLGKFNGKLWEFLLIFEALLDFVIEIKLDFYAWLDFLLAVFTDYFFTVFDFWLIYVVFFTKGFCIGFGWELLDNAL